MHTKDVDDYLYSAQLCHFVFSFRKYSATAKKNQRLKSKHKRLDHLRLIYWICLEQRFREDQGVAVFFAAVAACTRRKCRSHKLHLQNVYQSWSCSTVDYFTIGAQHQYLSRSIFIRGDIAPSRLRINFLKLNSMFAFDQISGNCDQGPLYPRILPQVGHRLQQSR